MITASIVTYHNTISEISGLIFDISKTEISKIYIIDNSINDSLREITKLSSKIVYIHNQNIGYGGGHNIGINKAIEEKSNYHIVINPDIRLHETTINTLADFMNKNNDCGLVMPKILYPNEEIQYLCKLLPTPLDLLLRRFIPTNKYIKKRIDKYELRFTDYNHIMEVPSLSGCFMFLRVNTLKETGGFDERYFMYAEDLDLCRRINEVSKTFYNPKTFVYHEYNKASYHNNKMLRIHIYSIVKYFNKWGWFLDNKRSIINKNCIQKLKYKT